MKWIFGLLLLITSTSTFCQESYIAKEWTLNSSMSGNETYMARDKIIFKSGFSVAPGSGETFHAIIADTLLFDIDYYSYIDPDTRDITSNQVGTLPGEVNVSGSGAATYTIPIDIPPGTAGMEPSVSIVYNSQSGIGYLGQGWELAGISAITRIPMNYYYDNTVNGVDFQTDDRFALDGNRLVLYGNEPYGSNGAEYRTANESFSKITSYGSDGNGPRWFKVETKSGLTIEYGNTPDSRIQAQGKSDNLLWYISKVEDNNGNYIRYYYHDDNGFGEFWPDRIEYTGNSNTNHVPFNKIKFYYEIKSDDTKSYLEGSVIRQKVVLNRIKVFSEDDLCCRYEFKYATGDKSHLIEIQKYTEDGSPLNSTVINWGKTTSQFTVTECTGNNGYLFFISDYNGDGKDDFIRLPKKEQYTSSDKWELFINTNGNDFSLEDEGELSDYYLPNKWWEKKNKFWLKKNIGQLSNDFTGDGLDDFILAKARYCEECPPEYYSYEYRLLKSGGNDLEEITGGNYLNVQHDHEIFQGDFDGDGVLELLAYEPEYDQLTFYSFKDSNYIPIYNFTNWGDDIYPVDFNGNGKTDLMIINDTCSIYEFSNYTPSLIFHGGYPTKWHRIFPGDFNGDGKTDVLTWSEAGWELVYSKGDGSFQWPVYNPPLQDIDPEPSNVDNQVFIHDFNGDGRMDILQAYKINDDSSNFSIHYFYNHDSLIPESNHIDEELLYRSWFNIGDYNGDGKMDIFFRGYPLSTPRIFRFHPDEKNFLVHSITNGFNNKTEIGYKALTDNTIYTKGEGAVYPLQDIQPPLYVVSSVSRDNGVSGTTNTYYNYEGAKVHLQGLGLLGYTKTRAFTPGISEIINESEIKSQSGYCILLPEKQINRTSNGISISRKIFEYSVNDFGRRRIFPYISTSSTEDSLTGFTIENEFVYDTLGNLDTLETTYGTVANSVVANEYTTAGSWCLSKLSSSTTTKTRIANPPYIRTVEYEYDNSTGLLISTTSDPGKSKSLTTRNFYDSYGNIIQTRDSTPGLSVRHTSFEYDTKGRFVTKTINAIGQFTTASYNNVTGNILTSTNELSKTTFYEYDGQGRLKRTILPTGKTIEFSTHWYDDDDIDNCIYFTRTIPEGSGESYTYCDILGRELKNTVEGFDGQLINTDKEYTAKGQVLKTSDPYYSGESVIWTDYLYDSIGRVTEEKYDGTTKWTKYIFIGNKTKTINYLTSPQQFSERTIDATGKTTKITDNGGEILYAYNSADKIKHISPPGSPPGYYIGVDYDEYGRQDTLIDIDAGLQKYSYNAFGELESQTDARGDTYSMEYDVLGRLTEKEGPEGNVYYSYYSSGNGLGQISSISGPNGMEKSFTYDKYGRVKSITEYIESGTDLTTSYKYDDYGRMASQEYPSGYKLSSSYDQYGYLSEINDSSYFGTVWTTEDMDQFERPVQYKLGNSIIRVYKTYDGYGMIDEIKSKNISNSDTLQDMEYDFTMSTGNLHWRKDNIHKIGAFPLSETFTYDSLNRLKTNRIIHDYILDMSYDNTYSGNIESKSDAGNYEYNQYNRPHAVIEITDPTDDVLFEESNTYTPFNKISTIIQEEKQAEFEYGPEESLKKMSYFEGDPLSLEYERYYSIDYEKLVLDDGTVKEYHYINSPDGLVAVYIVINGSNTSGYFVLKDHLGSITTLADNSGQIEEEYSFDPWGRRRDPEDWREYDGLPASHILTKGFTGHEHLDDFGLINMTGRVYDPVLGRFLSPDNYVQFPEYTQSFNRYTYALNNPLKYTDPEGELLFQLLALGVSYLTRPGYNPNAPQLTEQQQNLLGLVNFASSFIPSVPGIVPNGLLSAASNIAVNGITNTVYDQDFFNGWGLSTLASFAGGAYNGYNISNSAGLNNWWGSQPGRFGEGKSVWSLNPWRDKKIYVETVSLNMGSVRQTQDGCVAAASKNAGDYLGINENLSFYENRMGKPVQMGRIDWVNNKRIFRKVGLNSYYTDDIKEVVSAMRNNQPNLLVDVEANVLGGHAYNLTSVDIYRRGKKYFYKNYKVMDPSIGRKIRYAGSSNIWFYILNLYK